MSALSEVQKMEEFQRPAPHYTDYGSMKVEERLGFEQSLQIDEAVWRVLPKIQARGHDESAIRPGRSRAGSIRPPGPGGIRLRYNAAG